MAEVLLTKTPGGSLVPSCEEAAEALKRFRVGGIVRCNVVQMRNPGFHRKWFALVRVLFDLWCEYLPPGEWRGMPVQPNLDRFRQDITILAGHGRPVWNIRGEMRMEADSISFANMDQATFEKLYSATINAGLEIAGRAGMGEQQLRDAVDNILRFDA